MKENIILIGFMGAGKTSVGKAFARRHGLPLLDTDQLIEEEAGMTISRIFAEQGEEAFRRAESAVLGRLLEETDHAVISVGGGLPLLEANREILKKLGTVVFLRVRKRTVLKRLAGDNTRPLLQGDGVEEKVERLLEYRNPLYEQASHLVVDVDGKTVRRIVDEVTEKTGISGGFEKNS